MLRERVSGRHATPASFPASCTAGFRGEELGLIICKRVGVDTLGGIDDTTIDQASYHETTPKTGQAWNHTPPVLDK